MFEEACSKGYQSKATKFEVFAEQWFEEYAKPDLRKRVYSAVGHMRMDKITPKQIQAFVNSLSKNGANERTGKPLAPKTIHHDFSFISDVFSYAVRMDLVSDDPCRKVTIPKGEVKEKPIYMQEEMAQLLTAINGESTKYRAFFFLIAYSGFGLGKMSEPE